MNSNNNKFIISNNLIRLLKVHKNRITNDLINVDHHKYLKLDDKI